ncbi:hypothetical protein AMS68_007595 [Peltaster fructicola]|uniref:RWD domain-containing protein n=1 Tax=Peltaster fructicola TaxID=286661 RepID=A0A6H0Y5F9_9PEZI|nr:hypothetical protein AMS68_007595 [Peltaster fructicola]
MGREDQIEERQVVLESIFPDEITDINETEYRISMILDVTIPADDETEPPSLLFNVRYPEAYPDEAPILDITQPPNAPKFAFLDVQEDKGRLLDDLKPTIEENMGIQMIFTLYSAVKEAAEQLVLERQQAKQNEHESELRKAEEEENRKFEGEKVTPESFLAWRDKFKQELADEKARVLAELEAEEKKKRGKVEEKKLSGRQLWEQGLAGKVVEDDEEGEDGVAAALQAVQIKA